MTDSNVSTAPSNPSDRKYSPSHEWLRLEADGSCTIGISHHAQEALGELVYVELPDVGEQLSQGDQFGVVESTKAASDVYCPVAGEIIAINQSLADAPEAVNNDPFETGWLIRIQPSDPNQLDKLLSAEDYSAGLA